MRLRLFTDPEYASPVNRMHCAMLIPFLGNEEATFWTEGTNVFGAYKTNGQGYFDLVDTMEEAQFAVLPSTWHRYLADGTTEIALRFAQKAADAGKQIIVFHERDYDYKFPAPNALLFTPTVEEDRRPNEFGLPAWVPDHMNGPAPLREKQESPSIGFCGHVMRPRAKTRAVQFARTSLPRLSERRMGGYSASLRKSFRHKFLRAKAVQTLLDTPGIDTQFLLRGDFFAGADKKASADAKTEARQSALEVFLGNLRDCDYSLCVRGIGNYSLRFYEIMAAGRPPLFFDTGCVLPYDGLIDWHKELIWVPEDQHDRAGEILLAHHRGLSDEAFVDQQKRVREVWEEWLSPDGFFRNFYRHFQPN
ncbi:exostosin family protein [Salipiger sp. PrR002]|uniref:exostosin family protein n=1 Tax=Salipiger sp. PrR002 TaxID=2706489 RepID=UPI0013B65EBF|nr:exostosin family protein [Salipiger sp. PrR002]NDW00822.1 exostosin family protein [Salipiger sp. PrR002]NDW59633.1 exostosin family protein [Salipiger sp. PrR004]